MAQHFWQNHSMMSKQGRCKLIKTHGYGGLVGKYLWIFMDFQKDLLWWTMWKIVLSQRKQVYILSSSLRAAPPGSVWPGTLKVPGSPPAHGNPADQRVKLPGWSLMEVLAQDSKQPPERSLVETGGSIPDVQSRCKPCCFWGRASLTALPPIWLLHPRTVPGIFNLLV